MNRRAGLVALLVVALVAIPLVLGVPQPLDILRERFVGAEYPAPPTVALTSPRSGAGVGGTLTVEGLARGGHAEGPVTDVQVRLDDGAWESIADVQRGSPAAAFRVEIPVEPGDHVVAARAFDGRSYSYAPSALVRSGSPPPPTAAILSPDDGAGVAAGPFVARGTAEGEGIARVLVGEPGSEVEALLVSVEPAGAVWEAELLLAPGLREIHAIAVGAGGASMPATVVVSVGAAHAPPELRVLRPADGEGVGSAGSDRCLDRCVAFTGDYVSSVALKNVTVTVDGSGPFEVPATPAAPGTVSGVWTYDLDLFLYFRGEHRVSFVANDIDGLASAPREVAIMVNAARSLRVVGDLEAQPTSTPLHFAVDSPGLKSVRWFLDGVPIGTGPTATAQLDTPGRHALDVEATASGDDAARAIIPLFAINRAPTVSLAVGEGGSLDPIDFRAQASDPEGAITGYRWSFGDGTSLELADSAVAHVYGRPGAYNASVIALDDLGKPSPPAWATVHVGNLPPIAAFSFGPDNATLFDDVLFEDASTDPDGNVVERRWDFGDGSPDAEGADVAHTFRTRGPHLVTLTAIDNHGAQTIATRIVTTRNLAPTAAFNATPTLPRTGEEVAFQDASVKLDGRIVAWRWDFGDGATASGANARHAFAKPGPYNVTLVIEDDFGARALAAQQIRVADAPPTVAAILVEPQRPTALETVRFRALALDREGGLAGVRWDFGDGARSNATEAAHAFARSGEYLVQATVIDGAGQEARLNTTVYVSNAPPIASLAPVGGVFAGLPSTLESSSVDPDGSIKRWEFDVDSDGTLDCPTTQPRCTTIFPTTGAYVVTLRVVDDEDHLVSTQQIIEVVPPPRGVAPPTVTIATPTAGTVVQGEMHATGHAFGPIEISIVEAQVRNGSWTYSATKGLWTPARGTHQWFLAIDSRALPDGHFDLVVRATDIDGTWNETLVPILVANGEERAGVDLRVTNLDPSEPVVGAYVVKGTAFHPDGVTTVRYRVDEGPWLPASGNRILWEVPLDGRRLEPGEHVLRVDAYRTLVERTSLWLPFTVPNQKPALFVDLPPGPSAYALLHAEGRASDTARVMWRVDDDLWRDADGGAAWSFREDTKRWTSGPHVVRIKAVDRETGLESAPIEYRVRFFQGDVHETDLRASGTVAKETPGTGIALTLAAFGLGTLGVRRGRRP